MHYVAELGGSISSEHGIGAAKQPWLHLNRSEAELTAFRRLKTALDPAGIMNPNVLLPAATVKARATVRIADPGHPRAGSTCLLEEAQTRPGQVDRHASAQRMEHDETLRGMPVPRPRTVRG